MDVVANPPALVPDVRHSKDEAVQDLALAPGYFPEELLKGRWVAESAEDLGHLAQTVRCGADDVLHRSIGFHDSRRFRSRFASGRGS